jgi:hypothetical protein
LYRGYHVAECRVADDKKIDVAGGMKLTACGRTEDERCAQTIGERHQRLAQDVHESDGFGKQTLQLWEDGRLLVGLKVHLVAADLAAHQARGRQQFQLALSRTDGTPDVSHELPQVVRLVGMTQEPSQYAATRATEQNRSRIESGWSCPQDGDKRIQNGNGPSIANARLSGD